MTTLLWDARYSLRPRAGGFSDGLPRGRRCQDRRRHYRRLTRTMTTAVASKTSKGNLPLAMGLGSFWWRSFWRSTRGVGDARLVRAAGRVTIAGTFKRSFPWFSKRLAASGRNHDP